MQSRPPFSALWAPQAPRPLCGPRELRWRRTARAEALARRSAQLPTSTESHRARFEASSASDTSQRSRDADRWSVDLVNSSKRHFEGVICWSGQTQHSTQ
jgi:hypothetical protein